MMHKKMIHDIRYVGLAGEINFSQEPYMYQDTDLFNYNIEYDLNYFPSGRGGKVKRFKQLPQVNTLTLGVINRTDVRELVSKLERHFQVDINAKTPAKLFINGSYTECYIVSSVKTYFNRFLGINFITLEILREKPVWTIEEEYSYQKANLQTNPYDLNLIKPPYDFSNFEFTQPARPLKEANLIKNGWDDFEPYGTEGAETKAPLEVFEDGYTKNVLKDTSNEWFEVILPEDVWFYEKGSDFQLEVGKTYTFSIIVEKISNDNVPINLHLGVGRRKGMYTKDIYSWRLQNIPYGEKIVLTHTITGSDLVNTSGEHTYFSFRLRNERKETTIRYKEVKLEIGNNPNPDWTPAWEDLPEEDKPVKAWDNMAFLKTPLGNGLTRIRTWGGNSQVKLSIPNSLYGLNEIYTLSTQVKNLNDKRMVVSHSRSWDVSLSDEIPANESKHTKVTFSLNKEVYGSFAIWANTKDDTLDFIASDPIIYEDDGSMIYDIQEYEDKYRIFTMNSHSRTKMKLPIKKSIFKNEQYTHSIYAENLSDKDVLITSEKGIYINDPVIEVKPNEKGVYAYTGTVAKDNLYTTFEMATKEPKDDINIILDKPAVSYGDKPFDWPPEEEIVPLKLPTHIPFWITVDDSVKYISNNSIGDTLAKITIFGPIKNPTLYIGSNTYRVYEELLENERIEIDQRAKTVTKITSSGDRVNVFHLRDKEHSIFKPIPEGENAITQNDDFSYTIILYYERNEPKWT